MPLPKRPRSSCTQRMAASAVSVTSIDSNSPAQFEQLPQEKPLSPVVRNVSEGFCSAWNSRDRKGAAYFGTRVRGSREDRVPQPAAASAGSDGRQADGT